MILKKTLITYLLYCLLLSLLGYIVDCIMNLIYAVENIKYLLWYFVLHSVFQFYIILPAILLYTYIFEMISSNLILKILLIVVVGVAIAIYLFPDDYSLYIGEYKKIKQISIYVLSGIIILFVDKIRNGKRYKTLHQQGK